MRTKSWQRAVSLIVITSYLLASCATLEDVAIPSPDQPSATPSVRVGDTVEVTTRDGKKQRFKVTAVETDALVGADVRVRYADMQILRVEHGSAEKSGKTIAIVLGAFLVVGALVLASEY